MKIIVSGSTGFIGSVLCDSLKENHHEVYRLMRHQKALHLNEISWDPEKGIADPSLLEGFDVVIHLAGENIMGRWTNEKKHRIRETRVNGTRVLVQAFQRLKNPPSVFICGSAIGFYGNRGGEILTEESPKGSGFLSDVCAEWEREAGRAAELGIRTLSLRIGMVLSEKGGALKLMVPAFKLGLGGQIGKGTQEVSWIALQDLVRIIEFVMSERRLAGPINCAAPCSATNQELTHALGKVLHRPTFMKMPEWVIKLVLGELGEELLLSSTRAEPKKLLEAGFSFKYPRLEPYLEAIL